MSPAARPRTSAVAGVVGVIGLALAAYAILSRQPATLFQGDSPFGAVRVVEYADGLRALYLGAGRARQSAIYPGRPLHLEHAYTRVAMAGLALAPPDARLLFVGLGGGAMPMYAWTVMPRARLDVVEIDPLVVDVAVRFFGFSPGPRLTVHVDDGRAFLERAAAGSWDVVFLDAFSDDEIPRALTTRGFLESVRSSLTPTGVVVSNLWTSQPDYPDMVATYHAVFDQVALIRVAGRAQVILMAATRAGALDRGPVMDAVRSFATGVDLGFDLPDLVSKGYAPSQP